MVKRHVHEVVKWASDVSHENLSEGRGKKALDVGCAYGYTSSVLEGLGYEVYGLDISRWGVRQATRNCDGHFLVCDVQASLPFAAETFDLVTCFDVLEHLLFPEKAIQNMLETCSNALICTTPNKIVEKAVRKLVGDYDETHINARSPSEWKESITQNFHPKLMRVKTFFDLTVQLGGLFVYKSFKMPALGLTVRIIVKK
jgi:2-polyprenyl-3-methyl-5-hydroxy-6-metoxy-1,4-benzoquinol methylase